MIRIFCFCCLSFLAALSPLLLASTTETVFSQNKNSLFQIRVVDRESDSKSSLGSGFIVRDEYSVATNYHVISSVIAEPEKYRIIYVREDDTQGELTIEKFDIVNDLALLQSETPLGEPISLAESEPNKGALIYAMGNPLDLGMTIVPGTYNGLADHAYYQRIHFSGSINSGMSGGPVLNQFGELIGINVATAGNQVSFLVPSNKLSELVNRPSEESPAQNLSEKAERQLHDSQQKLIDKILKDDWPKDKLGDTQVIGEIPGLVSCWGRSSRDDDGKNPIVEISKGCSLQDSIYISPSMTTGSLEYEFYWIEAEDVKEEKFVRYLSKNMGGFPANRASKDDVSEFQCHEDFTDVPGESVVSTLAKSFYCVRRYKKFSSLFDVLYIRLAKRNEYAFISHFTLAGVSQESANRFSRAFFENVSWP